MNSWALMFFGSIETAASACLFPVAHDLRPVLKLVPGAAAECSVVAAAAAAAAAVAPLHNVRYDRGSPVLNGRGDDIHVA